jgi:hypothetical protein
MLREQTKIDLANAGFSAADRVPPLQPASRAISERFASRGLEIA